MVHLIQVDVVGAQPPQGLITRTADIQRGQEPVIGPRAHATVELGGQDDPVPPPASCRQPAPDDLLGHALRARPPVGVRCVQEVDPVIQRAIHDLVRFLRLGDRAEVHRAEAEPADLDPGTA
jgi:hypothetical protein